MKPVSYGINLSSYTLGVWITRKKKVRINVFKFVPPITTPWRSACSTMFGLLHIVAFFAAIFAGFFGSVVVECCRFFQHTMAAPRISGNLGACSSCWVVCANECLMEPRCCVALTFCCCIVHQMSGRRHLAFQSTHSTAGFFWRRWYCPGTSPISTCNRLHSASVH